MPALITVITLDGIILGWDSPHLAARVYKEIGQGAFSLALALSRTRNHFTLANVCWLLNAINGLEASRFYHNRHQDQQYPSISEYSLTL